MALLGRRSGFLELSRLLCVLGVIAGLVMMPAMPSAASATGKKDHNKDHSNKDHNGILVPRVHLIPDHAVLGEEVLVEGFGFWEFEPIDVTLDEKVRATVEADDEGDFRVIIQVPVNNSLGVRKITVQGTVSTLFDQQALTVENEPWWGW